MKDPTRLLRLILPFFLVWTSAGTLQAQILFKQQGHASYYADRFQGRKMANGKPYHRDSMTCAHLRYPLGTTLLVRNLLNGREVVVTVTDRGPYTRKFVIDLSRAAARQLDILQQGYQLVEIVPYIAGKVPYKYEPTNEHPELDLGYSADIDLGPPMWQDDSIYWARHRLSRTAVIQNYKDSLRTTLSTDTTLRKAAIKAGKKKKAASRGANAGSRKQR